MEDRPVPALTNTLETRLSDAEMVLLADAAKLSGRSIQSIARKALVVVARDLLAKHSHRRNRRRMPARPGGAVGVRWDKSLRRWRVFIKAPGFAPGTLREVYVGSFPDRSAAVAAQEAARRVAGSTVGMSVTRVSGTEDPLAPGRVAADVDRRIREAARAAAGGAE